MEGQNKQNECGKKGKSTGLGSLLGFAASEQKKLIIAATFMLVSAIATAGYAYLVGPMIRTLFMENEPLIIKTVTHTFFLKLTIFFGKAPPKRIAAAIFAVAAVKGVAFYIQNVLTAKSGQNILHQLRMRLFEGLVHLNPLSPKTQGGDLVARFTADVTEVESAVTVGVIGMVRHLIELVALATLCIALDYRLGLIGLVAFPPAAIAITRLGRSLRRRRSAVHAAVGNVGGAVAETAHGLAVIQAFDAQPFVTTRFDILSRQIRNTTVRALATRAVSSPLNEVLAASALSATLLFAAEQISRGTLLPETFVSFFAALFMLYQPVKGIGTAHHAIQSGLAALDRLAPLMTSGRPPTPKTAPPFDSALTIEHVSCGYESGAPIIEDINIRIRPRERIAVVGPSGAGKSTLFNLLLGFLSPRAGRLTLDGRVVPAEEYRRLFALVRQEPFLLNDSIIENIGFGRQGLTPGQLESVCRSAGVLRFADALPDGLMTHVGHLGDRLSVGQRQRIALARALITHRPILLLDELTASIDGETEGLITDALDRAFAHRTVIVITHRLATARWAERIIAIDDGRIVADGRAAELLQTPPMQRLFGDQLS